MMKQTNLFLLFIFLFGIIKLDAQTEFIVKGKVLDKETNMALPFASVLIHKTLKGTVTNDSGVFELKISQENAKLEVSYIGYLDEIVDLDKGGKELVIYLSTWETELETVVVRPQSAEFYIKEAVINYKNTLNPEPFETRAFFKEKSIQSNGKETSVEADEAVFLTYYANYIDDTLKNNSRLLLYRNLDDKEEMTYAFEKRLEKKADKWEKRADRRDAKKKKKGKETKIEEEKNTKEINIGEMSNDAGPDKILKVVQSPSRFDFLDSINFKKVEFSFGPSTHYNNRELLTINFKTKKKLNGSNYDGVVYLDQVTLAFVAFDYTENVKIPFLINALIKTLLGIKIENIAKVVKIRNQIYDNYWYPKDIRFDLDFEIFQGGIFKENETASFQIEQSLTIDNINTENTKVIAKGQIFNAEKEYEEQIHNAEGIKWSDVNIVID